MTKSDESLICDLLIIYYIFMDAYDLARVYRHTGLSVPQDGHQRNNTFTYYKPR